MSEQDARRARVSHEFRLLLLTIALCVIVLLALARLRFPETPVVETAVQPLERLAARASYDALAADIERVQAMISPNLVVLRTAPRLEGRPRRMRDVLVPGGVSSGVRHVPALRISAGTAIAVMDVDVRIDGIVGGGQVNGTAAVLGTDPIRRISRVRVPEVPVRQLPILGLGALRTPVYVVAVEGTQAGVTLRPVFLGHGERFGSARWAGPLLPLGGIALAPGALLFSLSGEFLGCVVVEEGSAAIAGARDVLDGAERLGTASAPVPATFGVAVQPLTPLLAAALGALQGVVVSEVEPEGPAAGVLRPADVVTAVNGEPVASPERFLLQVATATVGEPARLTLVRESGSLDVSLVPAASDGGAADEGRFITFERASGAGTRVTTAATEDGGYGSTGLRAGDVVISVGGMADPTPVQLRRLLDDARPEALLAFVVRRDGEQRVVAVRPPARADASPD